MNRISLFLSVSLVLVTSLSLSAVCVSTDHTGSGGPYAANPHVKSVTAIAEVFGEGQKITAAAVEYDKNIAQFEAFDINLFRQWKNNNKSVCQ